MWYAVYISKECAEREMFRRGQQFRWRTSLSWQTTDNIAAFFFLTTLCLQQRFYTRLDLITQWSIHLFRRTLVQIHREIRKLKWQKKRVSVSTISYERNMLSVYTRRRILTFSKNKPAAEIAEYEATWTVSTFRPNWGVDKMRDNNPLTYWQWVGTFVHTVETQYL